MGILINPNEFTSSQWKYYMSNTQWYTVFLLIFDRLTDLFYSSDILSKRADFREETRYDEAKAFNLINILI